MKVLVMLCLSFKEKITALPSISRMRVYTKKSKKLAQRGIKWDC